MGVGRIVRITGVFLILAACTAEEGRVVPSAGAYFPLHVGMYHTYTVDETIYTEVAAPQELHYELFTEVTDSIAGAEGEGATWVVRRSTREESSGPWEDLDVWSVRMIGDKLLVSEGNTSFIKLVSPPGVGRAWNGNAYNSLGDDLYEVGEQGYSFMGFTDCVRVVQHDEDNLVYRDHRIEIYARDVGLVRREMIDVQYCADPGCLGTKTIKSGRVFSQTLTEYGG